MAQVISINNRGLKFNDKLLRWDAPIPSSYCAEYQAVYAAYDTKPDAADAVIDNTLVEGLVSDGVWAKLDGF